MKGLTIKEPYASLMLFGKTLETRVWSTDYRGQVLICASKKPYDLETVVKISGDQRLDMFATLYNNKRIDFKRNSFFNGQAIAVGELVDCRRMTITDEDQAFVTYNELLYVHSYVNVVPIVPFDIKGQVKLFTLTDDVLKKIKLVNSDGE